ncbi:MAG: PH domain-containing protein [Mycobacteriaceae bacterium]
MIRSRKSSRYALVLAGVVLVLHIVAAVVLRTSATGVNFRIFDQLALVAIGIVISGALLLMTRPVVKVKEQGVLVRNIFGHRFIIWDHIMDISFPDGKPWARVELPQDEYIALMAIQANDKDYAAQALAELRSLYNRYR